ncbi:protein NEDD1-like isoform X2 [Physella acuta]|uniref:protein NEDD1-like isoform X2 n=1 Tax=Physella acuta TaxID=109671 RepID=UPI0027DE006F|nr:protein NEDD1-like isoform X2 [Physella acuta]
MICLASTGDEAKIWDAPTFSLLEQFNSHDSPISDLTWSHDGHSIATCCNTDRTVHLRLTKASHSIPADSFTLPAGCLCLDYNSYSRFLLCGCVDGSLHIWDRKTQSIKKSYSKHRQPVSSVRWNWNDTYIALGSESGEIVLYNVVTGQASSPLMPSSTQAIRQMKYNPYRKASLVSASDDGVINVWDTNSRRLLHSFSTSHQAPAKDLAFSPINDCLMVSVGLDKRAIFYDVQNKSPVKTIVAEQPLTSVDMMHDGATVVVGTSRGKIFFYDMRQASTPVFSLAAHKSSVRHLSFIKKEDSKNDNVSRRQLPSTPLASENLNQNASHSSPRTSQLNNFHLTGLEAFSPLAEGNKSNASVAEQSGNERSWMYNKSVAAADITHLGEGVFSPLRNDSHSINSLHGSSSLMGNNSFLMQILASTENSVNDLSHVSSTAVHGFADNPNLLATSLADKPPHDINLDVSPLMFPPNGESPHQRTDRSSPPHQRADRSSPPHQRADRSSPPHQRADRSSPPHQRADRSSPPHQRPDRSSPPHQRADRSSPPHQRADRSSPPHQRTDRTPLKSPGSNGSHLIQSRLNTSQLAEKKSDRSSAPTVLSSDGSSAPAVWSIRHLVQELLSEQFREHHQHLKSEIKFMLGQSGAPTQPTTNISMQKNPEVFHAEFLRNLVREELEDLKDFIHKEFWCVQVELIKQVFQLQKRMELGFAECQINPALLEEIQRLKEENSRLKRTF